MLNVRPMWTFVMKLSATPASMWNSDGVTITVGTRRATFLPSVWEKVPAPDEFLDALWLKAGLRPRTWPRGLQASRYTATEYFDAGPRSFGPGSAAHN